MEAMRLHEVGSAVVALGVEQSAINWPVVIAGIFVLFSLSLSTFLLFDHLSTYNDPEVKNLFLPSFPGRIYSLTFAVIVSM